MLPGPAPPLLLQLDGKIPNLALLRIAHHHRGIVDRVTTRAAGNWNAIEPRLNDPSYDKVYASAIFERTKPLAERIGKVYPGAVTGGPVSTRRYDCRMRASQTTAPPTTPTTRT